jgi:hypothetical protein
MQKRMRKFYLIMKNIKKYNFVDLNNEEATISNFIKNNPISMIPYEYTKEYVSKNVTVYTDSDHNMKYVLFDNKRLYFPQNDDNIIKEIYNNLLIEQNINSPHRYESFDIKVEQGDIVVDVGAAEGIFALSVIEKVQKVYLFEAAEKWTNALKMTFMPWKGKVVIINKYVSDSTLQGWGVTIDEYFNGKKVNFIKADIEGSELKPLNGAKNILSNQNHLKVVICTYHKENDAKCFKTILEENGFKTEFSNGFIIPTWDINSLKFDKILEKVNYYTHFKRREIIPLWKYSPFFRRGVIRGIK